MIRKQQMLSQKLKTTMKITESERDEQEKNEKLPHKKQEG